MVRVVFRGFTLLMGLAAATAGTRPVFAQDAVDLREFGYDRGDPDAPVAVVEFGDFGCSACGQFARESLSALHDEFVETGKVRWKYVPFLLGAFPNAAEAARAAECAAEQDAFWAMHDRLFAEQRAWSTSRKPETLFRRYAGDLELDAARFDSCYREKRGDERTRANNRAAARLGVRATPTFFINGKRLEGAPPLELFRALLTEVASRVRP